MSYFQVLASKRPSSKKQSEDYFVEQDADKKTALDIYRKFLEEKTFHVNGTKITPSEALTVRVFQTDRKISDLVAAANVELERRNNSAAQKGIFLGFFSYEPYSWLLDSSYENLHVDISRDIKKEVETQEENESENELSATEFKISETSNKVFIVHGHDKEAKLDVANFLRELKYEPVILSDQASKDRTIYQMLRDIIKDCCYGIVIYTPCDLGRSQEEDELSPRARENVIFEHGILLGMMEKGHLAVLKRGDVKLPGDVGGLRYIEMNNNWQTGLIKEMRSAGLSVTF